MKSIATPVTNTRNGAKRDVSNGRRLEHSQMAIQGQFKQETRFDGIATMKTCGNPPLQERYDLMRERARQYHERAVKAETRLHQMEQLVKAYESKLFHEECQRTVHYERGGASDEQHRNGLDKANNTIIKIKKKLAI